jgi:hypothetical protein
LLPDYLAAKKPNLKSRTLVEIIFQLVRHAAPNMPVKALDHERIADLLRAIGRDGGSVD